MKHLFLRLSLTSGQPSGPDTPGTSRIRTVAMAGKTFTAEYQRQGLQVGRAPLPVPPAAPAPPVTPPDDPVAAAAMLASLERIERRLAELDAIQVAPTVATSP